jgi:hypothetical protein
MAFRERFRSGGAGGIARFLAEHQEHDAGFDVLRAEGRGTGRMRVICNGCGESAEYRAAEVGELAAIPELLHGEDREIRAAAEPRGRGGLRFPRKLGTAGIVLLVSAGLVLIAVGFLRDGDGSPSSSAPTSSTPASVPAISAPPAAQPPQQAQRPPSKGGGSKKAAVVLHSESFGGRFAIGVAPHWSAGEEGTAVRVVAPGSDAEIDIYFEAGDRPMDELADSASSFLRSRHAGGKVGAPSPMRLAHTQALRIPHLYAGGSEVAVVLVSGGYAYLLLKRLDSDVSGSSARQASAVLASLDPQ